uniref:G_PROTEIN_RECEP_F1_2 domain-containing protein n=1 Tax=Rhabditophanes sp. KR3021 TaxID=114890 RepID=A0AC35TVT2_9BILA
MFLIPFATLIFVNCKIIMALKQSTNLRSKHSRKGDTATGDPTKFTTQFNLLKGSKYSELFTQFANNSNGFRLPRSFLKTQFTNSVRDRSVTLMLLAIVATFFGCNILAFCNNIVEILVDMSADGAASLNQITFEKSVEISNILISLNSATSIFIYIIFSSKFRQTLKIYLGLEKREENVPKKINYVAVTTAMAAHRALDISIIPNEIANHHQIKSTETVQHNFNKQSPHILRSVGAPVKQTQQGDDEEKRGLLCEHTDNSTIIQEETQTVPLNSISQMTITTSTDNEK